MTCRRSPRERPQPRACQTGAGGSPDASERRIDFWRDMESIAVREDLIAALWHHTGHRSIGRLERSSQILSTPFRLRIDRHLYLMYSVDTVAPARNRSGDVIPRQSWQP